MVTTFQGMGPRYPLREQVRDVPRTMDGFQMPSTVDRSVTPFIADSSLSPHLKAQVIDVRSEDRSMMPPQGMGP